MAAGGLLISFGFGQFEFDSPWFLLALPPLGFFVVLVQWWDGEGQYKNYLLEKQIEKGLNS
jgi:hypothetical protein